MAVDRNNMVTPFTGSKAAASTATIAESSPDVLRLVGERVRGLRAKRGMTRKMLARDSSVSERSLAQLEQGQGNISIGLLLKVATALQISLSELVQVSDFETAEQALIHDLIRQMTPQDQQRALRLIHDQFSVHERNKHRIVLIGMRGAGKSTLGRGLAEHHGLPFIQLVAQIESLAGMTVPEIFALTGRSGYRRFEEQALQDVLASNDCCVIEMGGGIVSDPRMLNQILTSCFVVWIEATPEDHMQRVIDQGDLRPMRANVDAMDDLKRILDERTPFYAKAHAKLNTAGRDVENCLSELIEIAGLTVS